MTEAGKLPIRPDQRFYEQAARGDGAVWYVCRYLRNGGACKRCPRLVPCRIEPGDMVYPACRLLAEETVAAVLHALDTRPAP